MCNFVKLFTVIFASSIFSYSPPSFSANISLSICEYVAADDKKRLRSFLKSNHLKIRKIFKDLRCNHQNILVFAAASGSLSTGEMIIRKLSKKIVSANLSDLEKFSPELLAEAKKRIE